MVKAKKGDGATFWCSMTLVLSIIILLGSKKAEAFSFVPPVSGPIWYSPCPVNSGTPFPSSPENVRARDWYSVAWSGQYSEVTGSRCEGSGGHPGVDIRDGYAENTGENKGDFGVYSIGDGVVIVKKNLGKGWGNTIVIRHDGVPGYGTIYSVYAHLASFETIGEAVETWQRIGTMGHSGLGNDPKQRHLHFQIEPNWNDLSNQGVERCSRNGKPFWPCYTDTQGRKVAYPSSAKTCGSDEIDNCLSDEQRREAAGYVANNTINPMWLVAQRKDIWTTSVFSYAPGGGGPGGGLDNEWLEVGGWGDLYYSLIEFDLTDLPLVATSARIELFVGQMKGVGTTEMYLDRVTEFWDWRIEGTGSDRKRLWWADRPAAVLWIPSPLPAPNVGQWYGIDITDLYNAWQTGTYQNYGVQLRPVSNDNRWNEFYSSNYTGDTSLRPRLVVEP
jgi:murein DD-endopeptidase MepM/ murein hydrolase activator NlpD